MTTRRPGNDTADGDPRRQHERPARDVADHLRLALDAGGFGTWRWEMNTGEVVWDEQLERLFGLDPGSFDGTFDTYMSSVHPDDRAEVRELVRQAVADGSSYLVEHRVVWPDGTVHWVSGGGAVTFDERGEVAGTIGCIGDVTARVEQEVERRQLAAAAVESAERERVQRERLEFLSTLNDVLNASATVDDIMANVAAATVPRLGDWCAIHVLKEGPIPVVEIAHTDPSMAAYARELMERFPFDPLADHGVAQVIRTGQTQFVPDVDEALLTLDLEDDVVDTITRLQLRSSITVALAKRELAIGAMQFVMSHGSRPYTPDDVALAEAVAGRIAVSLENRRLLEHQQHIAQTLQASLLPAVLPDIEGIDLAVRYRAAGEGTEVGGDFYDLFAIDDQQWGVVVGDVCGKGPTAAALTATARHSIRDAAWHGDDPEEVLGSLNRAILRADINSFCTAAYATLRREHGGFQATVVCGGHPLPILVRGGRAEAVGRYGTMLGMFATTHFQPVTVDLEPGDRLVFYTDGATDLPAPFTLTDREFADLVAQACRDAAGAGEVADDIDARLTVSKPFSDRADDLALLVLRII